jgi:hypothetical protein
MAAYRAWIAAHCCTSGIDYGDLPPWHRHHQGAHHGINRIAGKPFGTWSDRSLFAAHHADRID